MSLRVSLGLSITALNRVSAVGPSPEPVLFWNLITQDRHAILTQDDHYIQVRREFQTLYTQSDDEIQTQNNVTIIV